VRFVGGRFAVRTAWAALGCLAAAALPALAAGASIGLADGTSLVVQEQRARQRGRVTDQAWTLGYSVTDAAGTRFGLVPPTADAARDSAPFLAVDDAGSAVLVWSRFDGSFRKIAYTRFAGGQWTDFHYLTFGAGDDNHPRIGVSSPLSYLFFQNGSGGYQYALIDLRAGRLLAPPRDLDLKSARNDIVPPRGVMSNGATVDIPVVNRCNADRQGCAGQIPTVSQLPPGGSVIQGGTVDIPIVNNRASAWGVGSSADCGRMVLVIPAHDAKQAFVFRFSNGATQILDHVDLPAQIQEGHGASLAANYLPLVCY
jgi:hypothetical protein